MTARTITDVRIAAFGTLREHDEAAWDLAPPDGFEPPTQALGRPRSIH